MDMIIKKMLKFVDSEGTLQWAEESHSTQGEEVKFDLLFKDEYIGSLSLRGTSLNKIEMFVPGTFPNALTRVGAAHFRVNFMGLGVC